MGGQLPSGMPSYKIPPAARNFGSIGVLTVSLQGIEDKDYFENTIKRQRGEDNISIMKIILAQPEIQKQASMLMSFNIYYVCFRVYCVRLNVYDHRIQGAQDSEVVLIVVLIN